MNLIQQAEELKNVPDQALAQMSQGMGSVPPYLVMSEMKRREQMRKAYTAQKGGDPVQRRTVMEEMRERFTPMEMQQQQQQPQVGQVAPNAPAPRMAGGGLTAVNGFIRKLAGGTEEDDYPMESDLSGLPINSQTLPQLYANQTFTPDDAPLMPTEMAVTGKQLNSRWGSTAEAEAAAKKFMESRKSSRLEGVAERLAQMEQAARGKKADIGQILMQLGLGMAASRRPDFAGAIGEGGLGALHGYMQQKQLNQAQADNFMKQRLGVLEAQQQSDDVATRSGDDYLRALIAARNTAMGTGEASIRAQQHAQQVDEQGRLTRQQQAKLAADRIAAEDARANRTAAGKYNVEQEAIKDWMQRNPGKSVMEAVAALGVAKNAGKPQKVGKGGGQDKTVFANANRFLQLANSEDKRVAAMLKQAESTMDKGAAETLKAQAAAIQKQADTFRQMGVGLMTKGMGVELPSDNSITPEEFLSKFKPADDRPAPMTPAQARMVHSPSERKSIQTGRPIGASGLMDYMKKQAEIGAMFAGK